MIKVDATNKPLGRLASEVAKVLMGKDKPSYQRHVKPQTQVTVANASKIRLTGRKLTDKKYIRHSGHPGGQKIETAQVLAARRGMAELVRHAVSGMLPKNKLHQQMMKNLKIHE